MSKNAAHQGEGEPISIKGVDDAVLRKEMADLKGAMGEMDGPETRSARMRIFGIQKEIGKRAIGAFFGSPVGKVSAVIGSLVAAGLIAHYTGAFDDAPKKNIPALIKGAAVAPAANKSKRIKSADEQAEHKERQTTEFRRGGIPEHDILSQAHNPGGAPILLHTQGDYLKVPARVDKALAGGLVEAIGFPTVEYVKDYTKVPDNEGIVGALKEGNGGKDGYILKMPHGEYTEPNSGERVKVNAYELRSIGAVTTMEITGPAKTFIPAIYLHTNGEFAELMIQYSHFNADGVETTFEAHFKVVAARKKLEEGTEKPENPVDYLMDTYNLEREAAKKMLEAELKIIADRVVENFDAVDILVMRQPMVMTGNPCADLFYKATLTFELSKDLADLALTHGHYMRDSFTSGHDYVKVSFVLGMKIDLYAEVEFELPGYPNAKNMTLKRQMRLDIPKGTHRVHAPREWRKENFPDQRMPRRLK